MSDLAPLLPPLTERAIARLLKLGEGWGPIVERVLATLTGTERRRLRDGYLRRAASLSAQAAAWTIAKALRQRMIELARLRRADPPDEGTIDGCLTSALRLADHRVPSTRTIWNLLSVETQGVEVSTGDVGHADHGEHPEGLSAHAPR